MTEVNEPTRRLPSAAWRQCERVVERFEQAWRPGGPALDEFLPQAATLRQALLVELAHTDLELRLDAGEDARAEDYLGRYPELAADRAAAGELIAAEFRLRRRRQPGLPVAEYLQRFPQLAEVLAARLADGESAPTLGGQPGGPGGDWPSVPGYEIEGELGRGGMGVVYRARQVALGRTVALKMVLAGAQAAPEDLARFRAEAQSVARLSHPHIVQVHEVGEHAGRPYLCLEFCPGGSLAQRLGGTPQPPRQAAALARTLALAVEAAHRAKVVHRDLKPANVMLSADGSPKVTDFGLAKKLDDQGQTATGAILGTPSYMAPEQAAGQGKQVGPAADVYALGAILYECLTGRPPFKAATPLDTILQVVGTEPVAPTRLQPGTPRDLEVICLKCLQKEPAKRYGSALELADDLGRFLAGQPIKARPVGPAARLWRACRRNPAVAALAAALALLLVVAAVGGAFAALRFRFLAVQAGLAQTAAEESAEESRQRLVQQYVAFGERLADEGDLCAALAWLAEALELDRGDEEREWPHRVALQSLLRQVPAPLDVWVVPELANPGRAASADGRRFLAVKGGVARVWDAETRRPLSPLRRAGDVRFACFGPDGRFVLTADARHFARVWDAATGRPAGAALAVGQALTDAALTADGQRVLTLTEDGQANLWDGESGQALPGPAGHGGLVRHVGFSPDGRLAVSAGDRGVYLWVARTGELSHELPHGTYLVRHASFSPLGDRLATATSVWAGYTGEVRIYSTATGRLLDSFPQGNAWRAFLSPDGRRTLTLAGQLARLDRGPGGKEWIALPHRRLVHLAGFSPGGQRVFTTTRDMTARLWHAGGWALGPPLRHGAPIWHAGFSADGRRWRTAGEDGVVRTWSTDASGGPVRVLSHQGPAVRLVLSPDGRSLVTGSRDGTARVWDLDTGAQKVLKHGGTVWWVAFSPDGRKVATSSEDGTARVWDARTGRSVTGELPHGLKLAAAANAGWVAAFSPDGRHVVTTGHGAAGQKARWQVQVWDAQTGRPVGQALRHTLPVYTAEFSPDGRHLLTAGGNGAFVWDRAQGARRFELRQGGTAQTLAAYSPDGARIVTASLDGTARVWDAGAGRPVSPPLAHGGIIWRVAFGPNSDRVLTAGEDGMVRVWDAVTGELVTRPLRHRSLVASASFSADGRFIVTSSQEGGRVWEAATGRLLTVPVLAGRGGGWGRAALTPDNRRVVTADHDQFVRVWDGVLAEGEGTAAELVLRARLVGGLRVDARGGLVPLTPAALRDAWAALRPD